MRPRSSNKQAHSISSFIDRLLAPPILANPFKNSSQQRNINDSISNHQPKERLLSPSNKVKAVPISPLKLKVKSQDKASRMYNNTKNYVDNISIQNSVMLSHISEVQEEVTHPIPRKQVAFRQNIIMKNGRNKRQNSKKFSRTPSILKKSLLIRNTSNQFIHSSQNLLQRQPSNISSMTQDRQGRAVKTNETIKKRYTTILQRFQIKLVPKLKKNMKIRSNQKYKDQLFPPIISSIYRGGNNKNQGQNLELVNWMRITDLFKDYKLVIYSQRNSNIEIYCNKAKECRNFIGNSFTSIRNCKPLFERIFQSNQINEYGIYLLKIFQQNVWKYVIIDDYIPVIEKNGQIVPLFCDVSQTESSQQLQIWPFLLQKAYANYYANYQSLHCGNDLDFLEEITGASTQIFFYLPNEKRLIEQNRRLSKYFQQPNIIIMGHIQNKNIYIPFYRKNDKLKAKISGQNSQLSIAIQSIYEYFDKIYVINIDKYKNTCVSSIGINIKKGQSVVPRFDISVRVVKLTEKGAVSISIRQKQKRFYQNSSFNYNYIWIRVILLQKQFDGDCRWIDGKYSNGKSVNLFNRLQAGQYYVILLPEWKSSHCYELSMIVNSTQCVTITKKQYDQRQCLIQKGCSDLAQRFGKLHQINLFACSYTYIHEEIGVLVQNINNQRYNGDIRINRSINGLKAAVDLIPFNIQFYQQKNNRLPFKTQISVYIPSDKFYTVVLIMRGGIDLPFLKKFDFGK